MSDSYVTDHTPTTELKNNEVINVDENTKSKTQKYPYQEVLAACIKYFGGDELAANVWINKYALKDSFGNLYELTPEDMHHRIASEIHRIELKYNDPISHEDIFNLLDRFRYIIPQGGPMTGIGNNFQIASLSNCFVIGNEGHSDSYGGILKTDEELVQLMKRRGGVGLDLSHIRPKGSPVMNSALTSTGVVPFMERYSNSTREVAQDGRRGALMQSISIKHPDAEDFIDAKMDGTKVTGANVSVRIDDDFMKSVITGRSYKQQFPVDSSNPKIIREIDARKLWDKIIFNAWKSAEPGVLFWDTIIRESVADCYSDLGFKTISTNPCGEIPLCAYDSCRLLAINLYSYVQNPFTKAATFDWALFKSHAGLALRLMDDIVDLEIEKIDKIIEKLHHDPEDIEIKSRELKLWKNIRQKCVQGRRTGVGITAEGDMLAAMGIRYGSEESIAFTTEIHKTLAIEAYRSSVKLARDRGAFSIYDATREKDNPFIRRLADADPKLYEDMLQYGRRNIALLTIAPTGTTSLMSQTTSGIEPVFMVSYRRRKKVNPNDKNVRVDFVDEVGDSWEEYSVFHQKFKDWLRINGYDTDQVAKMNAEDLNSIIEKSPYYKATANDVDWVAKVKMQGAIQKWVDHSISVTVNIPESTSVEMVAEIYKTGWESGCKGITVYRDGSRSGVLVSDTKSSSNQKQEELFTNNNAPKRPPILEADVIRFLNQDEPWIAVVGLLKDRPYEIFTGKAKDSFSILSSVDKGWIIKSKHRDGRSRYDFQYEDKDGYKVTIEGLSRTFDKEYWNYAKLISGVLRHGMPIEYVVDIVENLHLDAETLNNWKNGVIRALKRYIPNGTIPNHNVCPSCGDAALVYEEGCLNCKSCGMSKCN